VSWEIRVWHEELGARTRLSIEAGPEVPDEVISSVAGSYWYEEVQYTGDDWDDEGFDEGGEPSVPRLQG
jgi:hypothetical protein